MATGEDVLIENIRIIGNKLGGSRLLLLPMGGSGTIGTVFITDNVNTEPNSTLARFDRLQPDIPSGPAAFGVRIAV